MEYPAIYAVVQRGTEGASGCLTGCQQARHLKRELEEELWQPRRDFRSQPKEVQSEDEVRLDQQRREYEERSALDDGCGGHYSRGATAENGRLSLR